MFTKKIMLALFISANTAFFTQANDNQKPEITLTMEEVEQLIKEIEKDPVLAKKISPQAHSQKGLEEILRCVNIFEECEHPAIPNEDHKKFNKPFATIMNAATVTKTFKVALNTNIFNPNKDMLEDIFDSSYKDMFEEDFYTQIKNEHCNSIVSVKIALNNKTFSFYMYLRGYLQHKKSVNQ